MSTWAGLGGGFEVGISQAGCGRRIQEGKLLRGGRFKARFRLRKSCGRPGQLPPPEKLRQTWAALAPSKHKTHYVTSPHSAKPRRWPPDTCGMAFEKLILPRSVS